MNSFRGNHISMISFTFTVDNMMLIEVGLQLNCVRLLLLFQKGPISLRLIGIGDMR